METEALSLLTLESSTLPKLHDTETPFMETEKAVSTASLSSVLAPLTREDEVGFKGSDDEWRVGRSNRLQQR